MAMLKTDSSVPAISPVSMAYSSKFESVVYSFLLAPLASVTDKILELSGPHIGPSLYTVLCSRTFGLIIY
jgi:hypothetical protein